MNRLKENALGQKNEKFHVSSNFYDPVEKCKKWTKCTPLPRKYVGFVAPLDHFNRVEQLPLGPLGY